MIEFNTYYSPQFNGYFVEATQSVGGKVFFVNSRFTDQPTEEQIEFEKKYLARRLEAEVAA